MTMSIFHAVLSLSLIWQNSAQPFFINSWRTSQTNEFVNYVTKIALKCFLTSILIVFVVILAIYYLNNTNSAQIEIIIPILLLVPLLSFISPYTASIRAQKIDPFYLLSFTIALSVIIILLLSGYLNSFDSLIYSFILIMLINVLGSLLIFIDTISTRKKS